MKIPQQNYAWVSFKSNADIVFIDMYPAHDRIFSQQ